nr:hypothetical protein BaRGS_002270 [Batillaria attramentaria]
MPADWQGDTNVLIARVDWEAERERAWSETLEMERRQADDRERRLHRKLEKERRKAVERVKSLADSYIREWGEDVIEREEERARDHQQFMDQMTEVQRSAEERLSNLQSQLREERERGEQRLAAMMEQHENEKRQQQEKVMTFVLRVEGQVRQLRARVAAHVDCRRLQTVVQRLFDEFNVRLLGVDCGLQFLLDASIAHWVNVVERHLQDIQRVLTDLIPEDAREEVTWVETIHQLMTRGDKYKPYIPSLVVTDGGKIVMADTHNNKVKVMDSQTPTIVSSLSLGTVSPLGLAILHDKQLAVTSDNACVIHLIDVTAQVRVMRQIKTARLYQGVACGGEEGTLVVSCEKQGELPASVDIVSRDGQLIRTVVDSHVLSDLCRPDYLCVVGGLVLVSDCHPDSSSVYRVDLATGRVLARLAHNQLKWPFQVSADRSGNLYIASNGAQCVLVMGVDGRWRTLLRREEHGEGYVWPVSVAVTDTGVVVGWHTGHVGGAGSVVTGFDLT